LLLEKKKSASRNAQLQSRKRSYGGELKTGISQTTIEVNRVAKVGLATRPPARNSTERVLLERENNRQNGGSNSKPSSRSARSGSNSTNSNLSQILLRIQHFYVKAFKNIVLPKEVVIGDVKMEVGYSCNGFKAWVKARLTAPLHPPPPSGEGGRVGLSTFKLLEERKVEQLSERDVTDLFEIYKKAQCNLEEVLATNKILKMDKRFDNESEGDVDNSDLNLKETDMGSTLMAVDCQFVGDILSFKSRPLAEGQYLKLVCGHRRAWFAYNRHLTCNIANRHNAKAMCDPSLLACNICHYKARDHGQGGSKAAGRPKGTVTAKRGKVNPKVANSKEEHSLSQEDEMALKSKQMQAKLKHEQMQQKLKLARLEHESRMSMLMCAQSSSSGVPSNEGPSKAPP